MVDVPEGKALTHEEVKKLSKRPPRSPHHHRQDERLILTFFPPRKHPHANLTPQQRQLVANGPLKARTSIKSRTASARVRHDAHLHGGASAHPGTGRENPGQAARAAAGGKARRLHPPPMREISKLSPRCRSRPAGDAGGADLKVTVDEVPPAGALVSGKATFSDGNSIMWFMDQMGRFGMRGPTPDYQPPAADIPPSSASSTRSSSSAASTLTTQP
jgi:hypothetical protein